MFVGLKVVKSVRIHPMQNFYDGLVISTVSSEVDNVNYEKQNSQNYHQE